MNAKIFEQNTYINEDQINLITNFDLDRVQTLYSNLAAFEFV